MICCRFFFLTTGVNCQNRQYFQIQRFLRSIYKDVSTYSTLPALADSIKSMKIKIYCSRVYCGVGLLLCSNIYTLRWFSFSRGVGLEATPWTVLLLESVICQPCTIEKYLARVMLICIFFNFL